jgi:hypothetical protein
MMLVTCQDRGTFTTDELWRKQTRACVETAALLICFTDTEIASFGDDILTSLGKIGDYENMRELSSTGRDHAFVVRWTCLSITAVRRMLSGSELVKEDARLAIASYAAFRARDGPEDEVAEKNAQGICETLKNAWTIAEERDVRRKRAAES